MSTDVLECYERCCDGVCVPTVVKALAPKAGEAEGLKPIMHKMEVASKLINMIVNDALSSLSSLIV